MALHCHSGRSLAITLIRRSACATSCALVLLLACAVPTALHAQPEAYLQEMPSADRVIADISGRDAMESTSYLAFFSPSLPTAISDPATAATLDRLLSPLRWTVLPAMGLGFVIGSATDSLGSLIPFDAANFRGFTVAVLAVVPWLVVHLAIGLVRRRRFANVEMPRLHALVHGTPRDEARARR